MVICIKCKNELTDDNWYSLNKLKCFAICISCDKERKHKYYLEHREERIRSSKKWAINNPDKSKEIKEKWYKNNKDLHFEQAKEWLINNPEKRKEVVRTANQRLKKTIIYYYSKGSMICANPYHLHLPNDPFSIDLRCLSIDHINGGGGKHRKTIHVSLYQWLKRNNFPEGFQVLCMNCQMVKKYVNNEFTFKRTKD